MSDEVIRKILRGVCFGVLLALFPIVLQALLLGFGIGSREPSLWQLTKGGEFFLVATAITAASLGELSLSTKADSASKTARLIMIFLCALTLLIGGGGYAALKSTTGAQASVDLPAASGKAVTLSARYESAVPNSWFVTVDSSKKGATIIVNDNHGPHKIYDGPNAAQDVVQNIKDDDSSVATADLAAGASGTAPLTVGVAGRFAGGDSAVDVDHSLTNVMSIVVLCIAAAAVIGTVIVAG